jgi:hypothetical protein
VPSYASALAGRSATWSGAGGTGAGPDVAYGHADPRVRGGATTQAGSSAGGLHRSRFRYAGCGHRAEGIGPRSTARPRACCSTTTGGRRRPAASAVRARSTSRPSLTITGFVAEQRAALPRLGNDGARVTADLAVLGATHGTARLFEDRPGARPRHGEPSASSSRRRRCSRTASACCRPTRLHGAPHPFGRASPSWATRWLRRTGHALRIRVRAAARAPLGWPNTASLASGRNRLLRGNSGQRAFASPAVSYDLAAFSPDVILFQGRLNDNAPARSAPRRRSLNYLGTVRATFPTPRSS